jgi:hypothetical protein
VAAGEDTLSLWNGRNLLTAFLVRGHGLGDHQQVAVQRGEKNEKRSRTRTRSNVIKHVDDSLCRRSPN